MNVIFVRLARFGTVLALAVVMLGAWVRLHDAGLGCPDWPGCYGKLVVPDTATAAQDPGFAARPLVAAKAWRAARTRDRSVISIATAISISTS